MFPTYHNARLTPARNLSARGLSNLLDQFFDGPPSVASARPSTVLPLTIWEDEQQVHLEFDVPGVAEGDLDISLHDGVLTVTAERKAGKDDSRFDTRHYGKFEQRVSVPATVDDNSVAANLAHGVLSVTLSKVPEPKPRKISVNVNGAPAAPAASQN